MRFERTGMRWSTMGCASPCSAVRTIVTMWGTRVSYYSGSADVNEADEEQLRISGCRLTGHYHTTSSRRSLIRTLSLWRTAQASADSGFRRATGWINLSAYHLHHASSLRFRDATPLSYSCRTIGPLRRNITVQVHTLPDQPPTFLPVRW